MRVRAATDVDAARIADLHVRSWQAGYAGLVPQPLLDAVEVAARMAQWKDVLSETDWPRNGTLMAEQGDRLVGFLRLCPERGADRPRAGEVASLHVAPESWRQGVGRTLMDVALTYLASAGFDAAILWVVDGNDRAIQFYESVGWRVDGAQRLKSANALKGHVVKEIRMTRLLP